MAAPDFLSPAQARRVALAAQGFTDPAPTGTVTRRHLRRVLSRTGLLQIDSVNVLQRAHYLPVFSRLGPYSTALLDRTAYQTPRDLFEYWGHAASLLPVELYPLMRWRMARRHDWGGVAKMWHQQRPLVEWVLDEVAAKGPLTAGAIEGDFPRRTDEWGWNWSDVKTALELLFWRGDVLVSGRTNGFARLYDIPERVLPRHVLDAPTPTEEEQHRALVELAARSLGVASEYDLRDYYRQPVEPFKQALRELVEEGTLLPVHIPGWRSGYLHRDARVPRRISTAALLSPFDPVVWERARTERLFDFTYRIEIYVPAPRRVYGYYVLPFLLDDQIVARVDLKADRAVGVLRIPAAWAEPGAPAHTAEALAAQLRRLAGWLGLTEVAVPERGDLAPALAAALAGSGRAAEALPPTQVAAVADDLEPDEAEPVGRG
jgi:uncharacterized protein